MFSLFRAVSIFLVSLSFPPRSFPLLTLPKNAATPNALIRYLTRRDVCNYRQSVNYGPSAPDLILRHQEHNTVVGYFGINSDEAIHAIVCYNRTSNPFQSN